MRESDMALPVANWLKSQGYRVYPEEMQYDFVASNDEQIVIVEMKLSLTWKLCQQVSRAAYNCVRTYAAIATKPRDKNYKVLKDYGAGIILVRNGQVVVLDEPGTNRLHIRKYWEPQIIERLRNKPEPKEIIAGIPQLKGNGPMQRLMPIVREYFERNPKATWKQAFSEIPNHYANYRSFGQHLSHARVTDCV